MMCLPSKVRTDPFLQFGKFKLRPANSRVEPGIAIGLPSENNTTAAIFLCVANANRRCSQSRLAISLSSNSLFRPASVRKWLLAAGRLIVANKTLSSSQRAFST